MGLRAVAGEVLECLYQHPLLSTGQLQLLHAPGASRRWMQRVMSELASDGLVCSVRRRGALRVWYLTQAGAELVEALPDRVEDRRKLLDQRQAAGMLQAHTLAVNDVGVAFLRAVRERGDEFTVRSWRHEIAHPIGPAPGMRRGELLIADAVLSYLRIESDGALRFEYRFLELDRGTLPTDRLAAKLSRYARLYHCVRPRATKQMPSPSRAWEAHYPVFPAVLLVLADEPRARLHRRMEVVIWLWRNEPELARCPIVLWCCLLEDLVQEGSFGAVFVEAGQPERLVDWLGRAETTADGRDHPDHPDGEE